MKEGSVEETNRPEKSKGRKIALGCFGSGISTILLALVLGAIINLVVGSSNYRVTAFQVIYLVDVIIVVGTIVVGLMYRRRDSDLGVGILIGIIPLGIIILAVTAVLNFALITGSVIGNLLRMG